MQFSQKHNFGVTTVLQISDEIQKISSIGNISSQARLPCITTDHRNFKLNYCTLLSTTICQRRNFSSGGHMVRRLTLASVHWKATVAQVLKVYSTRSFFFLFDSINSLLSTFIPIEIIGLAKKYVFI